MYLRTKKFVAHIYLHLTSHKGLKHYDILRTILGTVRIEYIQGNGKTFAIILLFPTSYDNLAKNEHIKEFSCNVLSQQRSLDELVSSDWHEKRIFKF